MRKWKSNLTQGFFAFFFGISVSWVTAQTTKQYQPGSIKVYIRNEKKTLTVDGPRSGNRSFHSWCTAQYKIVCVTRADSERAAPEVDNYCIYLLVCSWLRNSLDMGRGMWLCLRKKLNSLITYLVFAIASRVSSKYFGSSC